MDQERITTQRPKKEKKKKLKILPRVGVWIVKTPSLKMGCYASAIAKLPPECFISDHYGKSFSWFGSWNGIHDCPLYTSTKLPQPRSEVL